MMPAGYTAEGPGLLQGDSEIKRDDVTLQCHDSDVLW
jgi:hypothetical protein